MTHKIIAPLLLSSALIFTACSHNKDAKVEESSTASYSMPVSQEGLDKTTEAWPESSKGAIKDLHARYGLPSAVTDDMIVWNNTTPFKRSIVYKEEVNHMFPVQHSDVLVQTVDYRLPLDKVAALSKFDGSLLVDRLRGEITARNQNEKMNILSLNLADKIVRGEMTVEEARREYTRQAEAFNAGGTTNLLTSLNFRSEGNTQDPDATMQAQEE